MSYNICEIDPNMIVETSIKESDLKFYSVRNEPFDVYGLYDYKNGEYTEIKYELDGFTLKASVLNGKLADEVTLLVPAGTSVKTSGWATDGKYKVKTVKLTENIEL